MNSMLAHKGSPYVRAIALLYLRYTHPSVQLWDWFEPCLNDETMFSPTGVPSETIELGEYAKKLLLELNYYNTIFPRIPVPVLRDIKKRVSLKFAKFVSMLHC